MGIWQFLQFLETGTYRLFVLGGDDERRFRADHASVPVRHPDHSLRRRRHLRGRHGVEGDQPGAGAALDLLRGHDLAVRVEDEVELRQREVAPRVKDDAVADLYNSQSWDL